MTDLDLLRQYVRSGCQRAFEELVGRHIDMVYATCLRRLRNRHDAEDATQAVFIALAGKASALADKTVIGGWLYRAASYICGDIQRKAKRREEHEMAAAIEKAGKGPNQDLVGPDIDQALAGLNSDDHEAIVLRFLEDRSFREVGLELRISEEAARKRVSRAIERLRGMLTAANGAALSTVSVEQLLHASLHPAPPGLLAATTKAALAGYATSSGGAVLTKGAVTIMATTYTKLMAGAVALVLLSGGAYVGYKTIAPPRPITVVTSPGKQITTLAASDWNKRFMDAYQLAPGQIVKFIDHVPVAERLQYWNSQPNSKGYFPLTPECTLLLKSNGSDLHWITFTPGWIPLAWAIGSGAGLQNWQMDNSIPQGMKFTGDWVFRDNATTQQVMDALANLVSQRLGRQVRFVKRSVVRDVLVARGAYKFVPLPAYPKADAILMSDHLKAPDARFIYSVKLAEVFNRVSMAKAMQVVDETGSGNRKVKVQEDTWHEPDAFVRTIGEQTSLHFDREPRQLEVWFMVDDGNQAPPQSQPSVASK